MAEESFGVNGLNSKEVYKSKSLACTAGVAAKLVLRI
jgi:hypothetical protein